MVSRLGIVGVFGVYLGAACGTLAAWGQYEPPTYIVRYVNEPPVIDGSLTAPSEWATAQPAEGNWSLIRTGVNLRNDLPDVHGQSVRRALG